MCHSSAGGHDSLSDPEDVRLLLAALPPHLVSHTHIPDYAHLDFGCVTDSVFLGAGLLLQPDLQCALLFLNNSVDYVRMVLAR